MTDRRRRSRRSPGRRRSRTRAPHCGGGLVSVASEPPSPVGQNSPPETAQQRLLPTASGASQRPFGLSVFCLERAAPLRRGPAEAFGAAVGAGARRVHGTAVTRPDTHPRRNHVGAGAGAGARCDSSLQRCSRGRAPCVHTFTHPRPPAFSQPAPRRPAPPLTPTHRPRPPSVHSAHARGALEHGRGYVQRPRRQRLQGDRVHGGA